MRRARLTAPTWVTSSGPWLGAVTNADISPMRVSDPALARPLVTAAASMVHVPLLPVVQLGPATPVGCGAARSAAVMRR